MIIWNPKDPAATVAYTDDWSGELGDDTIASYVLTITSGTALIAKQENSASAITAWIKGGNDQASTTFKVVVTTSSGQILIREYSLLIAAGSNSFTPTTGTKRALIGQAYVECSLNGWEYDIEPEELDKALTRLDMLCAELVGRGMNIGYNAPTAIGQGDLDDVLGCPDQAFFGLAVLLAQRLAPSMGKKLSQESREALNMAMKAVRSAATSLVPSASFPRGTLMGAGNRWLPAYRRYS